MERASFYSRKRLKPSCPASVRFPAPLYFFPQFPFFGRFLFFLSQFFSPLVLCSSNRFISIIICRCAGSDRGLKSYILVIFRLPVFFRSIYAASSQSLTSLLILFSFLLSRTASALLIFSSFLTRAVTFFSILAMAGKEGKNATIKKRNEKEKIVRETFLQIY